MTQVARALALVCGVVLGWGVISTQSSAQPLLRVQAGTRITLHGSLDDEGLSLTGALLDDLGAPLPDRPVALEVTRDAARQPSQLQARSAADGSFHASAPLGPGTYRVHARYGGDAYHLASEAERTFDLALADVGIAFIEPRALRIDLDDEAVTIAVRASSARGGTGLNVRIADERGAELARGRTDRDGMFRVELPASAFGPPGSGHLVVETEGDALRAPGRAEIAIVRARATRLTLQAQFERDHLAVAGALRDASGPLAGKAVGLFAGEAHIATLATDASGAFRESRLPLPAFAATERTLALQARFDSDAAWIGSSRSPVIELSLAPEPPRSPLWLLGLLAVTALAVYWLLGRRPSRPAERTSTGAESIGIHPAPGRLRGRPEQRAIGGTVRAAGSDVAVRGARVTLTSNDGGRLELSADDQGRFRSTDLEPGSWTLTIAAAGYAPVAGKLTIPHRGEWSDLTVHMESLRAAAVLAYKPVALRMLPSAQLWTRLTPRETLAAALRSGRGTELFAQLTERVEQAAYARTPPSAEELAAIQRMAREAMSRFPAAPSQSGGGAELRATFPHRR